MKLNDILNESIIEQRFKNNLKSIQKSIDEYDGPNIKNISPEKFNDGWCDHFAEVLSNKYPDIEYMSTDDIFLEFKNKFGFSPKDHAFIKFKNMFYDRENLSGVNHPFKLNFFQRQVNKK